jgi:hypothetical protein
MRAQGPLKSRRLAGLILAISAAWGAPSVGDGITSDLTAATQSGSKARLDACSIAE